MRHRFQGYLLLILLFQGGELILAQSWPASAWSMATNITGAMDGAGVVELSGLHYNPANNRLYSVQDDGNFKVLQWNPSAGTYTSIATTTIGGGPEGITQANLYANEFYAIDENSYEIRKYTYSTDFSLVNETKHWNLLDLPSPMTDTGNTGPEGIVFIPDSFLLTAGFISEQTGQPYASQKGLGGLFFIAHQDEGYVWVFDVNPNVNNDFLFVGKYLTNHSESCDLAFDRSTGLLYILHNISGSNHLEVTDLSTGISGGNLKFTTLKDYLVTNPTGSNDNIEGFALAPKCPGNGTTSAWLCRDAGTSESSSIRQDAIRWFSNFVADGSCGILETTTFETAGRVGIAPNPVDNELQVTGNFQANSSIRIFDSLGQLVFDSTLVEGMANHLNVSQLNRGIYLLVVQDLTGTSCTRFVKE